MAGNGRFVLQCRPYTFFGEQGVWVAWIRSTSVEYFRNQTTDVNPLIVMFVILNDGNFSSGLSSDRRDIR
jgi:hypothetical protein